MALITARRHDAMLDVDTTRHRWRAGEEPPRATGIGNARTL